MGGGWFCGRDPAASEKHNGPVFRGEQSLRCSCASGLLIFSMTTASGFRIIIALPVLAEKRGIPRVVSIRGMLEPWAFRHKRAKKRIAWWLYQRRDLTQAQCHITTGEAESQNLQHLGLGVPISIIPNGVDVPEKPPHPEGRNCRADCAIVKNRPIPWPDLSGQGTSHARGGLGACAAKWMVAAHRRP